MFQCELDNLTWHEVQRKVREVQSEQQMCIHKEQLTELDIYHRILRFKNYMVAMMNKSLIPGKITVPFFGELVCLSRGLRYNIELILFRGPWSPFENNWHLKDEFKRTNRRLDLASKLSRQILWVALANLILSPLIFLWQLMYFFFNYGELIKREPGTLGTRCWSQYGKLYLRHFNELDHELEARLNRAHRPAVKYMSSFSSPLMAVIAGNLVFICGGILAVLIVLTIYDEDVVQVEHVLTIISILTAIVVISRVFIPDENLIWCPEQLMSAVLAHVHYLPMSWRGLAHTSKIREQFGQLFQLRAIYLFNELFSPFTTPFILMWSFRARALDIVDFYRNFTVAVVGVGDVCSFAQMDIRKHGNPDWQLTVNDDKIIQLSNDTNQYNQGENGKTELSLVHFTLTNPRWKMPNESKNFVKSIRKNAIQDLNKYKRNPILSTAMGNSLLSVSSMGGGYSSIVQSILQTHNLTSSQFGFSMFHNNHQQQHHNIHNPDQSLTSHQQNQNQNHGAATSRHSFDFDRMLQQNLTDASIAAPIRSTLQNINEDDDINDSDDDCGGGARGGGGVSSSFNYNSMNTSVRGGISKREGPLYTGNEGNSNSLLYNLTGGNVIPNGVDDGPPIELMAADMSLSTLYLHELHNRHVSIYFNLIFFIRKLLLKSIPNVHSMNSHSGLIILDFEASPHKKESHFNFKLTKHFFSLF